MERKAGWIDKTGMLDRDPFVTGYGDGCTKETIVSNTTKNSETKGG